MTQVLSETSRDPSSRVLSTRAPLIGVAGSWKLPTRSTAEEYPHAWPQERVVVDRPRGAGPDAHVHARPNHVPIRSATALLDPARGLVGLTVSRRPLPKDGKIGRILPADARADALDEVA